MKENNYFAQNDKDYIHSIKAKHKFENNKIYKILYNIAYIESDYRVGFGDFGVNKCRLKEKGSIGFTNEGLYIEGKKILII